MKIGLVYLNNSNSQIFPVGLLSIAAMLRSRLPQHTVEIVDINVEDPFEKAITSPYDIIGISSMTIEYELATALARHIRVHTSAPIVLGGVHISTLPGSLRDCFDVGVVGEGEEAFCELVSVCEAKGNLQPANVSQIEGIVYFDQNGVRMTPRRRLVEPLDVVPKLDYSLIHPDYFRFRPLVVWGERGREAIILTSRGCPYKCAFCSTTQFWDRVRFFSIKRVIDEITDLVNRYRVDHIQIFDDLLTINENRLRQFAEEFRKNSLHEKVKLTCQSRTNLVDDELCETLTSLNIGVVSFGFESGNNRVLQYLKGGLVTVEQNKKAIETCVRHGFKVVGSVMLGSPMETLAEMEDTIRFVDQARRLGAYSIWSFVTTPFPATQMWDIAKSRGKVSDNMDFNLLTHEAISSPLLLDDDIDREQFRRVFRRCRRHLLYYRINIIAHLFRGDPFGTLLLVLSLLFGLAVSKVPRARKRGVHRFRGNPPSRRSKTE